MSDKDVKIAKELKQLRQDGKGAFLIKIPEYQILADFETINKLKFIAHELDGNNSKTYSQIVKRIVDFYIDNYHK
jgi:hypothetical protein